MPERSGGLQSESSSGNNEPRIYSVDFARALAFARKYRAHIVWGALAGAALGALFPFLASPVYTAETQVLIDPALPSVIEADARAPATMDSQKLETEMAVLRSEVVALATIKRLKLDDDPEFAVTVLSDFLPDWVSPASRDAANSVRSQRVLSTFRKNLTVRRVGVSYVIDVFFTAHEPELASKIANGVADAYMKFQIDSRNEASRIGSQWLEGRLIELRVAMNSASRKMQEHRASQNYSLPKSDLVSTSTTVGGPPEQPLTIEDLESTATTYRRVYESFLASYMAANQHQSFPISSAQIITRSTPPVSQSRSFVMIFALMTLLGVLAGAAFSMLHELGFGLYAWNRVRSRILRTQPNKAGGSATGG
jgi:uncharacterized protein involved in exopolysaccharide biosynthesis